MRQLTPVIATLADTMCALGADDPEAIARAIHTAECLRCLTLDDEFPCDGDPDEVQCAMAHAFTISLALLAIQAEPRVN